MEKVPLFSKKPREKERHKHMQMLSFLSGIVQNGLDLKIHSWQAFSPQGMCTC